MHRIRVISRILISHHLQTTWIKLPLYVLHNPGKIGTFLQSSPDNALNYYIIILFLSVFHFSIWIRNRNIIIHTTPYHCKSPPVINIIIERHRTVARLVGSAAIAVRLLYESCTKGWDRELWLMNNWLHCSTSTG